MKRLLIIFFLIISTPAVFAQTSTNTTHEIVVTQQEFWDSLPGPVGYTNDMEGLFTDVQIHSLDSIIAAFEKETTMEIAIVTLDSTHTTPEKFDGLAERIFDTWGIGKKDKNNGVLIALSAHHGRIRIVNGLGIETLVTDVETETLIDDYFVPDLKTGDYYAGTENGLKQLIKVLKKKAGY